MMERSKFGKIGRELGLKNGMGICIFLSGESSYQFLFTSISAIDVILI